MLKTTDLGSVGFRRATNRQEPALTHPTANAFKEEPWRALVATGSTIDRDYELATAAIFFGRQIRSLRDDYIGDSFDVLSKREVLRLAVARANRGFMLIRRRLYASARRSSTDVDAVHLQNLARRAIGNRFQPEASADDLTTALIDTLPHWFAESDRRSDSQVSSNPDFARLGHKAEAAFSIERTYRDLWQQVLVLQDLVECLLREGYLEGRTYPEIRRLSFGVQRLTLLSTLQTCLSITPDEAQEVMGRLTSDPADLASCFRRGVWHRPLIKLDENELLLVAAPIAVGNSVRRVEKWLQDSKLSERLSKTPPGILYERDVRAQCAAALDANPIVKDGEVSSESLDATKKDGEEIDFLARIGSTVLVGEIKCLLVPVESSECYDHRRKLEDAAAQVERKAAWLQEHRDLLASILGGAPEDRDLTFQPIVILNQAAGSGETIGSSIITDAHFLKLYLGAGSFSSGAVINYETGEFEPISTTLYTSEPLAEANLVPALTNPPGLKVYLEATEWKWTPVPTAGEESILVATTYLDEEGLKSPQARVIANQFLAANKARGSR